MDVETAGLRNIVAACIATGARRLIYLTSLGTDANSPYVWLRERGRAEQFVLESGLDATVIQPGQIVGVGGHGFNMMVSQARSAVAVMMGKDDAIGDPMPIRRILHRQPLSYRDAVERALTS
jgi:uncharacterized protein YbjT (DUF2867 family)